MLNTGKPFITRVDINLSKLVPVKFPDVIPDTVMKVMGVFFTLFFKTCV